MSPETDGHWLVDVAAAAGVHDLALPDRPGFGDIRAAWDRITASVGVPESTFATRVASHFRLPVADVERVERRALALLPKEVSSAVGSLPLRLEGETLVLATADPTSPGARERIAAVTGRMLRFEVTGPRILEEALQRHYSEQRYAEATLRELLSEVSVEEGMVIRSGGALASAGMSPDAPAVVELVRRILHYAAGRAATDVHVEPRDGAGRVRLRVDGVMQSLLQFPASALGRIIQRLRSLANLDPWDHTPGQEGTFEETLGGRNWEIRVRAAAVPEGQKLVLRLLDRARPFTLERLGYPDPEAARLQELLGYRDGLVLLAGPTRSGITTLTYCVLSHLATTERNVASLENPLEATLPRVNQTPFDRDRWPAYHVALQEVLHQDADVIGAGELRDLNTARAALRAGVTGHLVLAHVHTPDAAAAIVRLRDLGLDSGRVAESLRGVVSQRLVRRLCTACSRPVESREDLPDREQALVRVFGAVPSRAAAGCSACGNTGYRGQLACPEVLVVTDALRARVAEGAPAEALERAAFDGGGSRRMLHVALDRAEAGETTLAEVARVFGEEPSAAGEEGPPAKILVVDDDQADRLLVRTVLEGQGMLVEEAADGAAGLARIEREPDIAAMVLDLKMPGLSGLDVLRRIRGSFRTYALPVVVLTSSGDLEDEISLLEAGADDFVRKPVDPRRLMARLRAATRRSSALVREARH